MSRPAEALDRLGDKVLAEIFVAQIAGDRKADPAFRLYQGHHLPRVGLFRGKVVDRDIRAFAGIGDRGGPAHPRVASGDQGFAAGQPTRAAIACLAMVRRRVHLAGEPWPRLRLLLVRRLGISGGGYYLPKLLARIERGEIDPSFVITHRATLEDGPELYKTFRDKKDGCIKVVMKP
jgi:hypothetical protein